MLFLFLACGGETPPAATPTASPAPATTPAPAALQTDAAPSGPVVVPAAPSSDPARAAADDAFTAAMKAHQSGEESGSLVNKALSAYAALPTLDTDGRFHVAVLQGAAGDYPAAKATAEAILAEHPHHLLAIGAAARAAKEAGDTAAAKAWYQRYMDAWPLPRETLPEYKEHASLLEKLRAEAAAATGASAGASAG